MACCFIDASMQSEQITCACLFRIWTLDAEGHPDQLCVRGAFGSRNPFVAPLVLRPLTCESPRARKIRRWLIVLCCLTGVAMFGTRFDPDAFESLRGRVLGLETQQGNFAPRTGSLEHHIAAKDMQMRELDARLAKHQQRWNMLYGDERPPEAEPAEQEQFLTALPGIAQHEEMQASQLPIPSAPPESHTAELAQGAPLFTEDAVSRHGSLEQYLALAEVRSVPDPEREAISLPASRPATPPRSTVQELSPVEEPIWGRQYLQFQRQLSGTEKDMVQLRKADDSIMKTAQDAYKNAIVLAGRRDLVLIIYNSKHVCHF